MIIFGTKPKVTRNNKICANTPCPSCNSLDTFIVMIGRIPHIFFIPIPLGASDEGAGLYCENCGKMFDIEGKEEYWIEQYYKDKISKKDLFNKLNKSD